MQEKLPTGTFKMSRDLPDSQIPSTRTILSHRISNNKLYDLDVSFHVAINDSGVQRRQWEERGERNEANHLLRSYCSADESEQFCIAMDT